MTCVLCDIFRFMKRILVAICSVSTVVGATVLAQAPVSEIDAHIATAKTAAGQEYPRHLR